MSRWPAKIASGICSLLALLGVSDCNSKRSEDTGTITVKEVITKHAKAPMGESIIPVSRALARSSVLLLTTNSTAEEGRKISIAVDYDKYGQMWAYMYTDQSEFASAFPGGGKFVEMTFPDAFTMVRSDGRFAGIFINSSGASSYPIPAQLFDDVARGLR
jgi:hypothetical protein